MIDTLWGFKFLTLSLIDIAEIRFYIKSLLFYRTLKSHTICFHML